MRWARVLLSLLVAVSFGWLVVGAHWLVTSTGVDRLHGWTAWFSAVLLAVIGYIAAIGLGAAFAWGVCGWLDWVNDGPA